MRNFIYMGKCHYSRYDRTSDWAGRTLHPDFPSLIIIRNHAEHMRRRKAWNRAFNTTSLKGYEPVIERRVRQLVDALIERKNQVVDLAEWISFFTYVIPFPLVQPH